MSAKKNILVLCSRSPVALELMRSFYQAGHRVIIADAKSTALCRWSRYQHKFYLIPPPAQSFTAFSKAVQKIVKEEKITDCIPVYEESFYVSKIKEKLDCKVWTPDFEQAKSLHQKDTFITIAKNYFDTPTTTNYAQFTDFEHLRNYVFKPIYSRFANNIFIRPTGKNLEEGILKKEDWIAQEFIDGVEICTYSIWDEGRMKACCCYLPNIRFGKGASIFFEPSDYPELEKRIEAFGQSMNYHGQLSFDFIEKNGKYYVLECNPRATSGAHLFSERLAAIFFGNIQNEQPRKGSKGLKLLMFFNQPSLLFSKKYHSTKDVLFDRKDILPALLQVLSIVEIITLAWRKGITLLEATTYDIEWNGDESSAKK